MISVDESKHFLHVLRRDPARHLIADRLQGLKSYIGLSGAFEIFEYPDCIIRKIRILLRFAC